MTWAGPMRIERRGGHPRLPRRSGSVFTPDRFTARWRADVAEDEVIDAVADSLDGAVEEDEVVVSEELGGDVDDAGLDVAGRVEDLARKVAGGGDDNEPGECVLATEDGEIIMRVTYLWKTETQLRSPLAHLAWYSWNLGSMDCRKGPMKGSFMAGPTIEPFCMM